LPHDELQALSRRQSPTTSRPLFDSEADILRVFRAAECDLILTESGGLAGVGPRLNFLRVIGLATTNAEHALKRVGIDPLSAPQYDSQARKVLPPLQAGQTRPLQTPRLLDRPSCERVCVDAVDKISPPLTLGNFAILLHHLCLCIAPPVELLQHPMLAHIWKWLTDRSGLAVLQVLVNVNTATTGAQSNKTQPMFSLLQLQQVCASALCALYPRWTQQSRDVHFLQCLKKFSPHYHVAASSSTVAGTYAARLSDLQYLAKPIPSNYGTFVPAESAAELMFPYLGRLIPRLTEVASMVLFDCLFRNDRDVISACRLLNSCLPHFSLPTGSSLDASSTIGQAVISVGKYLIWPMLQAQAATVDRQQVCRVAYFERWSSILFSLLLSVHNFY